mmetsp:Transcript_20784/g.34811  ORF Transcript_20784/g.34811 Transcript_20784/m.34811 type:complete len:230 (-) Transcript_20784:1061-1750(-)
MASSDSNSSELYEKIAWIRAWQAVDRLIAVVTHQVNDGEDVPNDKNYCEQSTMITVKLVNYSESCDITPEVWSTIFSRKKDHMTWRKLIEDNGNIQFVAADQKFQDRKIQLITSGNKKSHVPWNLILKKMMKPSVQQESEQENVNPTTPHNKRLYDQVSEIFPNDVRIITPIGPNGAVRVILNVPGSRSNEQSRRNFRRNLPLDVTKQLVEAALRIIKDSLRTKCNLDR